MTISRRQLLKGLALSPLAAAGSASWSQDKFPARPMEMIVPWGPGGGADTVGRMVARWFESDLGGTMAVLNAPGATGVIGLSRLLQTPPDGHNMGIMTSDTLMVIGVTPKTLKAATWSRWACCRASPRACSSRPTAASRPGPTWWPRHAPSPVRSAWPPPARAAPTTPASTTCRPRA
jgi:hypothetical protein